jgi:hypothetical protein
MGAFLLVLSLVLSALAVLLLLLLLIFSVLPIPKASSFAAKLATRLATSIGDSYVLVESPTQFNAMVSRVRRDLKWLSSRCKHLAIVAHSQGAVVAHYCMAMALKVPRETGLANYSTPGGCGGGGCGGGGCGGGCGG